AATLARPFSARVGDARRLAVADAGADALLLLGPLYHQPDAAERARILAEAVRATRPGGVVCAAAISRYAWPLYALRDGVSLQPERLDGISATLQTGIGDPIGALPAAFSHRPGELGRELRAAGIADVEVHGIEG